MKQTVRFRVDFTPACSLGPGKIELLEAVENTGSLRQAAQSLGMSYRRAWLLLDALNRSFTEPAAIASVGGQEHRGPGQVGIPAHRLQGARAVRTQHQRQAQAAGTLDRHGRVSSDVQLE